MHITNSEVARWRDEAEKMNRLTLWCWIVLTLPSALIVAMAENFDVLNDEWERRKSAGK
jgi:hypothetical protein